MGPASEPLMAMFEVIPAVIGTRVNPVSYTHLDVYKRQDWFMAHCLPCFTQNLDELTRSE